MPMIPKSMVLVVFAALMVSCRKAPDKVKVLETVQITETRELTMWDTGSDSLIAPMPPEWHKVPGTQLRLLNYRFGEGEESGEVYISRANGGVLPNANRWLGQFGKPKVESIDAFPTVKLLGMDAVVVSASGRFDGGMGNSAQENAAVLGVIAGNSDSLLTVKMVGPADLVNAERARLLRFCENLRIRKTEEDSDVNTDSAE